MRLFIKSAAILALLGGLFTLSVASEAATVHFSCTLPTEREDGTALAPSDIASVNFYDVTPAGAILSRVATYTPTSAAPCAATLVNVIGTKRYVATVTDTQGLEGDRSNVVLVTTSKPKGSATLQVRVVFKVEGS